MMNRRYDGIDKDDGPSYGMASVGEPVGIPVGSTRRSSRPLTRALISQKYLCRGSFPPLGGTA